MSSLIQRLNVMRVCGDSAGIVSALRSFPATSSLSFDDAVSIFEHSLPTPPNVELFTASAEVLRNKISTQLTLTHMKPVAHGLSLLRDDDPLAPVLVPPFLDGVLEKFADVQNAALVDTLYVLDKHRYHVHRQIADVLLRSFIHTYEEGFTLSAASDRLLILTTATKYGLDELTAEYGDFLIDHAIASLRDVRDATLLLTALRRFNRLLEKNCHAADAAIDSLNHAAPEQLESLKSTELTRCLKNCLHFSKNGSKNGKIHTLKPKKFIHDSVIQKLSRCVVERLPQLHDTAIDVLLSIEWSRDVQTKQSILDAVCLQIHRLEGNVLPRILLFTQRGSPTVFPERVLETYLQRVLEVKSNLNSRSISSLLTSLSAMRIPAPALFGALSHRLAFEIVKPNVGDVTRVLRALATVEIGPPDTLDTLYRFLSQRPHVWVDDPARFRDVKESVEVFGEVLSDPVFPFVKHALFQRPNVRHRRRGVS